MPDYDILIMKHSIHMTRSSPSLKGHFDTTPPARYIEMHQVNPIIYSVVFVDI